MRRILRQALVGLAILLVKSTGYWRYPYRLDVATEPTNRLARLNWLYKSKNPVVRAEKGSGIESYFAQKNRAGDPLLPIDFRAENVARLSVVGDLMKANGLGNSRDRIYSSLRESIFGSDISFANLESTVLEIDNKRPGTYTWVTEREFTAFSGHQGRQYSIFSTANNHILDGGVAGINDVHRLLDERGFKYVGTNPERRCRNKGVIIDSHGIKFGFVAATFGVNHGLLPHDNEHVVNIIPFASGRNKTDLSLLISQIDWCRAEGCDFIVASLHWGHEFEFFPMQYQISIAHDLAEAGVDALIGHHSHTIQPFEIYQTRRDPHRKVPIFYSLGNFVSWSRAAYRCLSLIGQICVTKGEIAGVSKTLITGLTVTPVLQVEYEGKGNNKPYLRLDALSELCRFASGTRTRQFIDEAVPYADLVLGENWRDEKGIHYS